MGERLEREGLVHHGVELRFDGEGHRIPFGELTGGRGITIYGQQEVVKDLIAARLDAGAELLFEVEDVSVHELDSEQPSIRFRHDGEERELRCDVIAGCDGFHGVCRDSVPEGVLTIHERTYPFAWLGILARVAPSHEELIYCHHDRGFALHSMRSPEVTRLLPPVRPRRGHRRLARRADLGGAPPALRVRRLVAHRGPRDREGHHADAELRGGADAARPPLPRGRRGAHRAAHRREGAQPGRGRRARAGRGARGLVRVGRRLAAALLLGHAACGASGARSSSPGG